MIVKETAENINCGNHYEDRNNGQYSGFATADAGTGSKFYYASLEKVYVVFVLLTPIGHTKSSIMSIVSIGSSGR